MKKITSLFLILSFHLCPAKGQIVIEQVDFNNYVSPTDNDFVNRFNNGLGLAQITTNGITGGCLTVPVTMNWGNDNAIYCSKYIADSSYYCRTSIAFKYDTALFSTSGFDRAVSIFLHPDADFNHYVIVSVSHTQRIEILTYAWTNSPGPVLNLIHDHWYELLMRAYFIGSPASDQIDLMVVVNDLGVTGLGPPVQVNSSAGSIYDSVLFADTAIQVSFTATTDGGAKYLDNFQFEGLKSADSCISIPTTIYEPLTENFSAFVSGNELIIQNVPANGEKTAEIYSVNGGKIYSGLLTGTEMKVNVSDFVPGIYFVRVKAPGYSLTKKFAVSR